MYKNFNKEVKLFMIFDILGDTERTGPLLWHIDRKRLEDIKNHVLDLISMSIILRNYLPSYINFDKLINYIWCHDLPEAITGDITNFEGISKEEKIRVTNIAINYLQDNFSNIMDFKTYINSFENCDDIEAKIAKMLDRIHSSLTFIKYQSEQNIDMNDPRIIPELRNHPFVVKKIEEGKDLADIFYEFHIQAINITEEECKKYRISREDGNDIVETLKAFAEEMYRQKCNSSLFEVYKTFPDRAMIYNRNKKTFIL